MKVALFDKNMDYVNHFTHTAKTVYQEQLEVIPAKDAKEAKEILENNPDVVLVDEEFPWVSVRDCLKLYLTKDKAEDTEREVPAVHKYQKFGKILEKITAVNKDYQEHPEKYPAETKAASIIAFVSAAGGTGKSTLAMAYARRRAAKEEAVIFLSLESYSSMPMVFRCDGEKCLEAALGDVTAENYKDRVEQLVQRDHKGVYYIEPAKEILTDNVSTVEKIRHMLEALREMDSFDKIVIELGDAGKAISKSILEAASGIMLITGESDVAFYKTANLVKEYMADSQETQQWVQKMILLVNKAHMNMPVSSDMEKVSRKYNIGDCGKYRIAKAVELLTPQMQVLESN